MRPNKNIPGLLRALKATYPDADCALVHNNAFELLVATILSAQCTDRRVNMVTPALFGRYPSAAACAAAPISQLERIVRSTGFYRNKARAIREAARRIQKEHQGRVPETMDALIALPGVARKTANVVLGTAFHKAEGVVVDTHVLRLSARLGLSAARTPEKVERYLMARVPRRQWIWLSHALITHGRAVCAARAPRCDACPVRRWCPNPVA